MAMKATRPREAAEAAAWRLWESSETRKRERRLRPQDNVTVEELCDKYMEWAATYYRDSDGNTTKTVACTRCALREFREMFGRRRVADLEHADMIDLREVVIGKGLGRKTVNERLATVKRMVSWALEENLIYAQTKSELTQIALEKRRRSRARDEKVVRAAPREDVEAVAAAVAPSLGDMIRVHMLTGMRPEEICSMRWADIEKRGDVWIYRPAHHKNEWRMQPRAVVIGPRAQGLISRRKGEGEFVFSPKVAQGERFEEMRRNRKSKVQPSQVCRAKEEPMRTPGQCWTPDTYRRAVNRKCEQLGIAKWNPNQLRHSCATEVRRVYGLDAARAVLGHSSGMSVTDRYSFEAAEDELVAVATPAMLALG